MNNRIKAWIEHPPFSYWVSYTDGPGLHERGWRRTWRAKVTCGICQRKFWRIRRYTCKHCI